MRLLSSVPAIRRLNRCSLVVGTISGLGWAAIPNVAVARISGMISVIAGLLCGVCGLRLESLREREAAPRQLTTGQLHRFLKFTGATPKGNLTIGASASNEEAIAYSKVLGQMLRRAGWIVEDSILFGVESGLPQHGITILVADETGEMARLLGGAFREASIPVATVQSSSADIPGIFVGAKPPTAA